MTESPLEVGARSILAGCDLCSQRRGRGGRKRERERERERGGGSACAEMKLQAVMENLHRQQRAKLLMELQQQQQAGQSQVRNPALSDPGHARDERVGSPAPEAEHAQIAALAAMRAVAAGLQRAPDSPMSERSSAGEEEEDDDEEEEGEEPYKDMMGSEEEERM